MCHYVSRSVPETRMLINADLCLIMLIYRKATAALLTGLRNDAAATLYLLYFSVIFVITIIFLSVWSLFDC